MDNGQRTKDNKRRLRTTMAGDLDIAEYRREQIVTALTDALAEWARAEKLYIPFRSAHEGHSIIQEEFEELWDEVKKQHGDRDVVKMRTEAVQLAAMALHFITDVCSIQEHTLREGVDKWNELRKG